MAPKPYPLSFSHTYVPTQLQASWPEFWEILDRLKWIPLERMSTPTPYLECPSLGLHCPASGKVWSFDLTGCGFKCSLVSLLAYRVQGAWMRDYRPPRFGFILLLHGLGERTFRNPLDVDPVLCRISLMPCSRKTNAKEFFSLVLVSQTLISSGSLPSSPFLDSPSILAEKLSWQEQCLYCMFIPSDLVPCWTLPPFLARGVIFRDPSIAFCSC